MSAGFILQEQKMGMCCCRCGLHGLFSGLVRSCTLQPYNPSFCWVQFICECTIGVMLLGYVTLTLQVLIHRMIIYYRVYACVPKLFVWKVITQKASTFQAIYAVNLSLPHLACSFPWKYVGGVLVRGRLLLAIVFLETSFYSVTTAWWGKE